MAAIKPSIWAYNITDSWALFEGNIKTPRPDAGLLSMLAQTESAEVDALPNDIHQALLTAPELKEGNPIITDRLLTRFPGIVKLVSGLSDNGKICIGLIVNKNEKLYSVIVMGIEVLPDATAITSKIIHDHLK